MVRYGDSATEEEREKKISTRDEQFFGMAQKDSACRRTE